MIDWDRIASLQEEVGEDSFDEVVELFLEEVEGTMEVLGHEADAAELEKNCHFLKGSALNLGFQQLASLCHDAERTASTGDLVSVDVAAIRAAYETSKTAFFSELDKRLAS